MERITRHDLEYLDRLHGDPPDVLRLIDREGGRDDIPIVGTAVGRLLSVLVRATGAKRIVEVGTAIGYSALWMASAMPADGELVTIDPDKDRTDRARRFWGLAGVRERIRVVNEPALEALPKLFGPFDLAFIDALKKEYQAYLEQVVWLLRPGGTVVVDNLLWSGRASGSSPDDGTADTHAIREFNAAFLRDKRFEATILPVGDGIGIGVKR